MTPVGTTDALQGELAALEGTLGGGTLGVAACFLPTGASVFYKADETFPTASVIKAVLVAEWYAQIAEGRLDEATLDTIPPSEVIGGSGVLRLLSAIQAPGLTLPLRDLAALAIAVSDNTASNRVLSAVGGAEAVNRRLHDVWGMTGTSVHRPIRFAPGPGDAPHTATGTPGNFLHFLSAVAEGRLHNQAVSTAVWKLLRTCQDDALLPRYLEINPYADDLRQARPPFDIAHKTGAVTGVRNDVALITRGDRTLAVAVFSRGCPDQGWSPANQGSEVVARVGKRLCYMFFGD